MTTKDYGDENSWTLGTCSSSQTYEDNKEYSDKCCLAPGTHTLTCKDSYGDGWEGGYIEFQESKYCDGFISGYNENIQVNIQSGRCMRYFNVLLSLGFYWQ